MLMTKKQYEKLLLKIVNKPIKINVLKSFKLPENSFIDFSKLYLNV